jgi:hypothetical protein
MADMGRLRVISVLSTGRDKGLFAVFAANHEVREVGELSGCWPDRGSDRSTGEDLGWNKEDLEKFEFQDRMEYGMMNNINYAEFMKLHHQNGLFPNK